MSATVSIVTPSFNQGRFIERTIQSVLGQDTDGRRLEYVVMDGGSTDGTVDILRTYADRLRWTSEADRGQAHAINKGLLSTSGDVVGWVNSDDVYEPGALRAVCDVFETQPSVDVVYGQAQLIDAAGNVVGMYPTEPPTFARLRETCTLCQPTVFFRRRVIDRFGLLDERLQIVLDYEYWLRLVRGGVHFAHLPQVVADWRIYPEIKSAARRLEMHRETNDMFRERLGRVPDRWIFNYAHARLEGTSVRPERHLRFGLALAALSIWAALRWNHSLSRGVRHHTTIWVKDGIKLAAWSLLSRERSRLR